MTTNTEFATTRRKARISQGRIARRAGLSQNFISQFEIGNRSPRPEQLARLEDALRKELAQTLKEAARIAQKLGAPVAL